MSSKISSRFLDFAPYLVIGAGILIPVTICYSRKRLVDRLEEGVRKDLKRMELKGLKFEDIPKS